uniref:Uncharacterized protein n=1 Tax=Panagrolaimus sp. ES5 TaxID=591445 RepID=A0AC34FKS4_9BILA
MWLFLSLFSVILFSNGFAKSSQLVQIACNRNPELSFCDDPIPTDPKPARPNESKEIETILNLPTFEEHLIAKSENETVQSAENQKGKRKLKTKNVVTTPSSVDEEESSDDDSEVQKSSRKTKNKNVNEDDENLIPDDPILDHPVPSTTSKSNNKSKISGRKQDLKDDDDGEVNNAEGVKDENEEDDHVGSLLRLPKPPPRKTSSISTSDTTPESGIQLITPPALPSNRASSSSASSAAAISSKTQPPKNSRVGFVNVYISQFCVDGRKEFLVKCRTANVSPKDLEFCKSYPLECQSDEDGVVPLLAYCERFIHSYVRICAPKTKRDRQGRQFCKAYDQFCVPPPTPSDLLESNQALTRCEDIQGEARKVCNPFPPPHDRLNYLRCSQFVKFCSKFVDWQ